MDNPFINYVINLVSSARSIKTRSMFGGFGLFSNSAMFGFIADDTFYLRGSTNNEKELIDLKLKPYKYTKANFPITTKYYEIPEEWLEHEHHKVIELSKNAILSAKADKTKADAKKPTRIKELINMRLTIERILKKIGIDTIDKLISEGAVNSFVKLKLNFGDSITIELLWALDGAISNKHANLIDSNRRKTLLHELNLKKKEYPRLKF